MRLFTDVYTKAPDPTLVLFKGCRRGSRAAVVCPILGGGQIDHNSKVSSIIPMYGPILRRPAYTRQQKAQGRPRVPRTVMCESCGLRVNDTRCEHYQACNFCSMKLCHGNMVCLEDFVNRTTRQLKSILETEKVRSVASSMTNLATQPSRPEPEDPEATESEEEEEEEEKVEECGQLADESSEWVWKTPTEEELALMWDAQINWDSSIKYDDD